MAKSYAYFEPSCFESWNHSYRKTSTTALIQAQPHTWISQQHHPLQKYFQRSGPDAKFLLPTAPVATLGVDGQVVTRGRETFRSLSPITIYEDRFVRVTASSLRIKSYWFPLCTRHGHDIDLDSIKAVFWRTNSEKDSWLMRTWWACDCCGPSASGGSTVRLERDEANVKCFSVVNLNLFRTALEAVLSPDIPTVEDISSSNDKHYSQCA